MNALLKLIVVAVLPLSLNIYKTAEWQKDTRVDYEAALINSLDENNDFNDPVSLIVSLEYDPPHFDLVLDANSVEKTQEYISEIRRLNKEYYTEMNILAIKELGCDDLLFRYSSYSPFLFCDFSNYEEYLNHTETIDSIRKNKIVKAVFVEPIVDLNQDCTINSSESLTFVPIQTAKTMIGIETNSYTGSGIKVGILDGGESSLTNFAGGQIKASSGNGAKDHATKVASIIGGTYGIANEADLYVRETVLADLDISLEWLLDYNVNLINVSLGTSLNGVYDGRSAYLDYIVANEYVSIIKSAGNRGNVTDKYITNPGMGLNVFSVGSIDGNQNLSHYSSYNVNSSLEGIVMKPTLVAPGEHIIIPNTENSTINGGEIDGYSGTSFSAPMVTGCLALLMEQFPILIAAPELALSALINGADYLPSQTSIWDDNCGAGLLNYSRTVSLLSDGYLLGNVPNGATDGFLAGSRNIILPALSFAELSFVHCVRSSTINPSTSAIPLDFSKYRITVTDANNLVLINSVFDSNLNIFSISNETLLPKALTVSIHLNGNKVETGIEYSALTYSIYHVHSYNYSYDWWNYTTHKARCVCGSNHLEGHVVSPGSLMHGNQYGTCLLCGGLASIGLIGPLSLYDLPRTQNGSFILPNGVIVLVDEDFEAYLNGDLIFIDPNSI